MAGTEVLNGTQVPLDAAYILNLLAGNKLTERGQDIGWNDRLLTYYERERDAKMQWERDNASRGLEAANLNFQQRQADAQNELTRQSGVLGRDELNYRQRSDVAGKKLGIVDMLNSRRGPGNAIKYNSLLNQLDPPDAERSTTLDPFSILEGLLRESDAFSQPIASVNQPASAGMGASYQGANPPGSLLGPAPRIGTSNTGGGASGGGGGGSLLGAAGGGQAQAWGTPGYATNNAPTSMSNRAAEDIFSGVRNEDVAGLLSGQSALKVTGTGGPSKGGDYVGFRVANPATGQAYGADDSIAGGTNVWLTRLFDGGMVGGGQGAPMALTGDGRGKTPKRTSELAMAQVDAQGQPVLKVFSPEETRALIESVRARIPRAAGGGTYGTGNTDPTLTYSTYSPKAMGSQPYINKLFGGGRSSQFKGFGAELTNPSIGIKDAPSLLNMQAYNGLLDSEKDAAEELYGTGLETDWRDILGMARRSAPWGRQFGNASYGF